MASAASGGGMTMAEYIDKDAVYTVFANACTDVLERASEIIYIAGFSYELVIEILDNIPAADVAPVVHGDWEIVLGSNGNEYMVCTCCRVSQDLTGVFTYCPNCGARMDGGSENG